MKYVEYSNEIHVKIGMDIYNKPLLKHQLGDISYIYFTDIIEFCAAGFDVWLG